MPCSTVSWNPWSRYSTLGVCFQMKSNAHLTPRAEQNFPKALFAIRPIYNSPDVTTTLFLVRAQSVSCGILWKWGKEWEEGSRNRFCACCCCTTPAVCESTFESQSWPFLPGISFLTDLGLLTCKTHELRPLCYLWNIHISFLLFVKTIQSL